MLLRDENNEELIGIIASWVRLHSAQEVEELLDSHGVAACLIQNVEELINHPQVVARQDFVTIDDPIFGSMLLSNVLPRLSRTPGEITSPGPRLGQHTNEILLDLLGMTSVQVASLREANVV